MKTVAWAVAFGVVIGLLGGGLIFLISGPERGEPVKLLPPPTPPPLLVHVSGAVNQPGVYALPPGSRVRDAIQSANGFTWSADQSTLNLAAVLKDGDQVLVPALGLSSDITGQPERSGPVVTQPLINLNTATQMDLETLPHIGPSIAQDIIAYRQENGPFKTIEAIQDVSGIGPGIFAEIKDLITVGEIP